MVLVDTAPIDPAEFVIVVVTEVGEICVLLLERRFAVVTFGHITGLKLSTVTPKASGWDVIHTSYAETMRTG